MRNILQFSLVFLCFLSHLTEALFFGPIAVGLGVGILALKKGFLIGTALSSSRTRRSYQPSNYQYRPSNHYDSKYNRRYSKPRKHYYYSSSKYGPRRPGYITTTTTTPTTTPNYHVRFRNCVKSSNYNAVQLGNCISRYNDYTTTAPPRPRSGTVVPKRGKRETEHPEMVELRRIKREVEAGGFDVNGWYRNMTEMDQDDCGKKLVCELRAKQKFGFTEDERLIAENFGSGTQVDVSDITVEYDLAAQLGKYMGLERCQQLYNRCDLSSADMVSMIKTEMENLDRMKRDLENEDGLVGEIEREEVEETVNELDKIQKDEEDDDSRVNWVWT